MTPGVARSGSCALARPSPALVSMPSPLAGAPSELPMERDWTRTGWEFVIAAADRLKSDEAEAALGRLRDVFPPALIGSLKAMRHPIVAHQFTNAGRLALLELG